MKIETDKTYWERVDQEATKVAKSFDLKDNLNRRWLKVQPAYLALLRGDGNSAVFLAYCLWWSCRSSDIGREDITSFYKSYDNIKSELGMDQRVVKTAVARINKFIPGVLSTKVTPRAQHLVTWYTINHEVLISVLKGLQNNIWPTPFEPVSDIFAEMVAKSYKAPSENA